jgi:hypothetical protein
MYLNIALPKSDENFLVTDLPELNYVLPLIVVHRKLRITEFIFVVSI